MSYYDNVKDSVRDKQTAEGESEASFDTLKEAAQDEDDEKGNDTPIEVLEEDGLRKEEASSSESKQGNPLKNSSPENSQSSGNRKVQEDSEIVQRLNKIIDQNEKMIEILESFRS